jgi:hypothetical protein
VRCTWRQLGTRPGTQPYPEAYTLDLRTYFAWCSDRGSDVFAMTRPHLEVDVRWM